MFLKKEMETVNESLIKFPNMIDDLLRKIENIANQLVGYILSGDPTYITSHNNARSLIMKVERDELVEEVLNKYIENNSWN